MSWLLFFVLLGMFGYYDECDCILFYYVIFYSEVVGEYGYQCGGSWGFFQVMLCINGYEFDDDEDEEMIDDFQDDDI